MGSCPKLDEFVRPWARCPLRFRALVTLLGVVLLFNAATADAQSSRLLTEHPFLHAARTGDITTVRDMLARGDSPDLKDGAGQTPLMIAVFAGDIDMVEVLIPESTQLDAKDNQGNTALGYSIIQDQIGISEMLLAAGADPNIQNRQGLTPFLLAIKETRTIAFEIMLQYQPDFTMRDYTGRGAMGWARQGRDPQIVRTLEQLGVRD